MTDNSEESNDGVDLPPEEVEVETNLQKIIQDRRTERRLQAEQRRQSDLQCIREMKSTMGMDPLERFPKEIWAMIFDELDPEDLKNVWKVHPVFQELLKDTRIRDILLPLVILKVDAFLQILETDFKPSLRLISKSTMKSYDRWIEEYLVKRLQEDTRSEPWDHHDLCANFRLNRSDEDSENLGKALVNFGNDENPAKKFFLRGLCVSFSEYDMELPEDEQAHQELRDKFEKDITTLIQFIGDQIWHFRYFVTEQEEFPFTFTQVYMIFHKWIKLMPNLKWLEFSVEGSGEAEMNEAEALLQQHPFPHLSSLERFSLHVPKHFHDGTQIQIHEAVFTANPQLKYLDFVNGDGDDFRRLPSQLIKSLGYVTHISLADDCNHVLNILGCIKSIVNYTWPLQTITLEYHKATGNFNSIFQFLNKFPTLERVKIGLLQEISIGDTDSYGYLNLPNLNTLHFSMDEPVIDYDSNLHFFFSLQFLIHCKNLKVFHWYFRGVEDHKLRRNLQINENPQKTIDFRAGLRFLYDSNIWDVFPALEKVRSNLQKCKVEGGVRRYSGDCFHDYHRSEKGQKVTQFLKRHPCCRNNRLQDCIVFIE